MDKLLLILTAGCQYGFLCETAVSVKPWHIERKKVKRRGRGQNPGQLSN